MEQVGSNGKIVYLNTLKLFACFAVFLSHFVNFSYTMYGLNEVCSWFTVMKNGTFAVVMFVMIASLLVSMKIFGNCTAEIIKNTIVKRYYRLVVPILATNIVIFIISKLHLFARTAEAGRLSGSMILEGAYSYNLSFFHLLSASLIDIVWKGDSAFNYPLWMINQLFIGTVITIIICIVTDRNKYRYFIFAALFIAGVWNISFFLIFLMGTLLGYLIKNRIVINKYIGIPMFLCGLGIANFSDRLIKLFSGRFVKLQFLHTNIFYYAIAAFLIIYGIEQSGILKKICSFRLFDKMSRLSFGVYLIHWPLICSLSSYCFVLLYNKLDIKAVCSIVFAITVAVLIILSYLFSKLENKLNKLINKLTALTVGNKE